MHSCTNFLHIKTSAWPCGKVMLFNKDVNQCEWEAGGAGDNACRYTAQCLCSTSLSLITPDIMSEYSR